MRLVRCELIRWLSDDPFPGWVEAKLTDAHGRDWFFHDKPSIFSDQSIGSKSLPITGAIGCEVVAAKTDANGRAIVTVATEHPWGIAAVDGTSTFDVLEDQLIDSVVVSRSGGTRLMVSDGRWVVVSDRGTAEVEDSLVPLLPLLEHEPCEALRRVQSLGGPRFPWPAIATLALSGQSSYWQEQAVPWLDALHAPPEGELAAAAREAIEQGRASQRHRQQLHRWLNGKPIRAV